MPKGKQRKVEEEESTRTGTPKIDLISSLPDSLLCHILLFLPTRCAMATSILALEGSSIFAQRKAPHVKKLRLACVIPRGINQCITRVSCFERPCVFDCLRWIVDLPSLKNLELDLNYVDPDFVLLGCPALENLELILQESFPLNASQPPEIHMPDSLKRLTLMQDIFGEDINDIEDLVIDTPLLEYLSIKLWARCLQVSISDYPNMVEAHLDIDQDQELVGWVLQLLKALRQTKLLDLRLSTMKCLLRAPAFELPEFSRLHNLELQIPYFNSGYLIKLLHNCHMLQVLTLHNREKFSTVEPEEPNCWTLPMKDPDCVISHLKIFEFNGYQDSADEYAFVAYLLERGPILKTLKIYAHRNLGLKYKHCIRQALSTIPRSSKTCKLKVAIGYIWYNLSPSLFSLRVLP
ncbi:F-box/FBD/LRR-repeat protein [Arachis hypogaea]|uniref:F-box/FBD/LRR-repeat protein n=3 Tax=Arachis TaxID=3817 RepID=A0A6B9V3I7_ARAHY|nr:F-box/FBD/LRR-repeat protein [Arachis hypogaea]